MRSSRLATVTLFGALLTGAACGGTGGHPAAIGLSTASTPLVAPTGGTSGSEPVMVRREHGSEAAETPPPTAGLPAGRAPTSSPPPSQRPTPAATTAGDDDDPLAAQGHGRTVRANLGGDHHPIIPQQPFGSIQIPKIGLDHPMYEGVELPMLHWGPGHWPGTAMPGQFGNTVVAGHRVTHTRPFLDIDRLQPGDEIIVSTTTGRFVYEVTGHEIVTADDVHIADPTLTATITLLACHPKGSAAERYVVRGRLIG